MSTREREAPAGGPSTAAVFEAEELAQRILGVCGGGRLLAVGGDAAATLVAILLRRGVDASRVDPGAVLALPFAGGTFETVVALDVLHALDAPGVMAALAEVQRVTARYAVLTVSTAASPDGALRERTWWEQCALATGFRRHPLTLTLSPYESLEDEGPRITIALEKLPPGAAAHTLERLQGDRALHMDMLRESGRRADAHIARYHLACQFVRPGDVVLDVACGLGYGGAMLAAGSPAARVVGVDASTAAVRYAQDCYARASSVLEFREGDACDLGFLEPASVDYVVSFETLEHLDDPGRFLGEAARVLRPGGRVVLSVPNEWTDDSGRDPNPFHRQVYTWPRLLDQVSRHFRVERAWAQVAGGALKHPEGPRALGEVPIGPDQSARAEWWLVVGMKDAVGASPEAYRETSFPDHADEDRYNLTSFGRDYDNPWLVKAMVSIGMRSTRPEDLKAMAEQVLAAGRPGSPDVGAAICILGYQAVARIDLSADEAHRLLGLIDRYDGAADDTPHAWRWRVSNRFVAALLLLSLGRRPEAHDAFLRCAELDFTRFSPLLATKTVDACFRAGLIAAADGDLPQARSCWTRALEEARRAVSGDWLNIWGDAEHPVAFGLPEASQVLDLAARAAYALEAAEAWTERPGWSWNRAFVSLTTDLESWRRVATTRQFWVEHFGKLAVGARADADVLQAALSAEQRLRGEQERLRAEQVRHLQADLDANAAELASLRHEFDECVRALDAARAETTTWREEALNLHALWQTEAAERASQQRDRERLIDELSRIYRSRGWAVARRLTRARELVFPRDSLRERVGRSVARRIHVLRPHADTAAVPAPPAALTPEAAPPIRIQADGRRVIALQVGSFDRGGVEEVVLSLARHLQRRSSMRVIVIVDGTLVGYLGEIARGAGIEVVVLGQDRARLRQLLAALDLAVVNLHYTTFGFEDYVAAGVPIAYTIHNTYIWADDAFVRARAAVYQAVTRFIAVSDPVADFFISRFGVDPSRVTTIPNGLDVERAALVDPVDRHAEGYGDDDVVFINVASFNWHKFHVLTIAAMEQLVRRMPQARLLFVGNVHDAGCRALADEEIARRGLGPWIRIVDFVPKARVMGLMAMSDCFVLPSLIEGWSIAVLEAMSLGLPLILSDVGSARAVIEDSDIGLIVPNPFEDVRLLRTPKLLEDFTRDAKLPTLEALASAMYTIGSDRAGWRQRAQAGREKIRSRYAIDRMAADYLACFSALTPLESPRVS